MTEQISEPYVYLRNKESGVAYAYTPEEAKQMLEHPIFGEHLSVVRTAKPTALKKLVGKDAEIEDEQAENADEKEDS